ncbi:MULTISPECIES: hypothetical protein [unclassified Paraburkholderia]|uniref:hypothetical protein n=1 Tax=unclassified Paraburkholderia TaxID=2615204 RepID=UPI0016158905|nr:MULTISPECIES: hypothetical protein [unclassified Paraburkholderia]MBB5443787.1 hypothetical protein [Paraburkholderia sp. WSM4177]MBB5485086.1 hypothetical protein [Paraburkholderia sp. WSM4180]
MEQSRRRNYAGTLTLVGTDACNSSGNDDSCLRREVDDLCIALFDRWCERREIAPLVYLLHAWPFLPSAPQPVRVVSRTLHDLSRFHSEALGGKERELIASVKASAGD